MHLNRNIIKMVDEQYMYHSEHQMNLGLWW